MKKIKRGDRYYMASVRIGPKGQIVIPKEARDLFGLEPGDTLVLLADAGVKLSDVCTELKDRH